MNNLVIVLTIISCFCSLGISQQRLTEYVDQGTNYKNHLITLDSKKLLLQVDPLDLLIVYELKDIDAKTELHSADIPGLYSNSSPVFWSQKLVYGYGKKLFFYDMLLDSFEEYPLPSNLYYRSVKLKEDNLLISTENEEGTSRKIIYDKNEGFIDPNLKGIVDLFQEHYLEEIREADDSFTYVLHNYKENIVDTMLKHSLLRQSISHSESRYCYLTYDGDIAEYDPADNSHTILFELSLEQSDIRSLRMKSSGDTLALSYCEANKGPSKKTTTIMVFDLATGTQLGSASRNSDDLFYTLRIKGDVVLASNHRDDIFIFNFNKGLSKVTVSVGGILDQFISEKYLAIWNKDFWDEPYTLRLLDLNNFEETSLGFTTSKNYIRPASMVQLGDKFLLAFNSLPSNNSLYTLDLNTLTASINSSLDSSTNGLNWIVKLIPLKDGIIINGDKLLYYNHDSLRFIQDNFWGKTTVIDSNVDYVYFASDTALLRFDGEDLKEVVNERVGDIKLAENLVFYKTKHDKDLKVFDTHTGHTTLIQKNIYSDDLITSDDRLYYTKGRKVYEYNFPDTSRVILSSYGSGQHMVKLQDKLLITTKNGLYAYDSVGGLRFLKGATGETSALSISESGNHVLYGTQTGLYHHDGSTLQTVETNASIKDINALGSNCFLVYGDHKYLYDAGKMTLTEIPEKSFGFLRRILDLNDETKAVITKRNSNMWKHFIYDTDTEFRDYQLEFVVSSPRGAISAMIINDQGLLKLGKRLVRVNGDNNYEKIQHLSTVDNGSGFVLIDSTIYFIGVDRTFGRQLFSYEVKE